MPALITPEEAAAGQIVPAGGAASSRSTSRSASRVWLKAMRPAARRPTSRPSAAPPGCDRSHRRRGETPRRPARRARHRLFEQLAPADLRAWASSTPTTRASRTRSTRCRAWRPSGIFRHMFDRSLEQPRFVIRDTMTSWPRATQCFLTWDFMFRIRRFAQRAGIRGGQPPAASRPTAACRCTATTGTRPKSCTRSCRAGRLDALAQARARQLNRRQHWRSALAFGQRVELEAAALVDQPDVGVATVGPHLGRRRERADALRIIATTQGATSGGRGRRTTLTSWTTPCASISVSTIITPYSSGGSLPL
jgi:hypothetical protein